MLLLLDYLRMNIRSVCLHQKSAWRDPRGSRPVTRDTIVTRTQVEIFAGNSPSFGDESNQNHKFITHLDRGQHQVWLWHSIRTQLNNFYLRESRLCKMSGSFNNPFMSGCDQSQMPVDVIVYRYRQHPGSDSAVAMIEFPNFHDDSFSESRCISFALEYKVATAAFYNKDTNLISMHFIVAL